MMKWFKLFFLLLVFVHTEIGLGASLVESARSQVGITKGYDSTYRKIPYPNGDVALQTGVCSDVIIRAFRGMDLDLQKAVHEDMVKAFKKYPQKWGLTQPDSNIDHRRVPNLMTYFERQGWTAAKSQKSEDYKAGDIVAWNLSGAITHIGIVSDQTTTSGIPLVIHNIGRGTQEEDILFGYTIIGHYRPIFKK